MGAIRIRTIEDAPPGLGALPVGGEDRIPGAGIEALAALKKRCRVDLYTDSVYVRSGITEWLPAWRARGWRTADKKPVKNEDLWRSLDDAARAHEVEWHWVKGHAGHPENERADLLANKGIDRAMDGGG